MARKLNTHHPVYHTFSSVLSWSDRCRRLSVTAWRKQSLIYIQSNSRERKSSEKVHSLIVPHLHIDTAIKYCGWQCSGCVSEGTSLGKIWNGDTPPFLENLNGFSWKGKECSEGQSIMGPQALCLLVICTSQWRNNISATSGMCDLLWQLLLSTQEIPFPNLPCSSVRSCDWILTNEKWVLPLHWPLKTHTILHALSLFAAGCRNSERMIKPKGLLIPSMILGAYQMLRDHRSYSQTH